MRLFRFLIFSLSFLFFAFITVPVLNLFFVDKHSLIETLKDGEVWGALFTTLKGAAFSTILGTLLGVPAAYLLSEYEFKGREVLESILNLPVVIPHVAVGIILLKLLNSKSFLGAFFSRFGITFVDTIYGVVVAMCFVSVSYVTVSALLGFRSVDRNLVWSARSLGATPVQVFRFIVFPLTFPYILRGVLLSFARAVSEVGALLIIAYYPITAPILMYERFEDYGLKAATPIALLVVLFSLLIFTILLTLSSLLERKNG